MAEFLRLGGFDFRSIVLRMPTNPSPPAQPSLHELRAFFEREFPQSSVTIEAIGPHYARVRQHVGDSQLRPGGTVSGPAMMAVADSATYAALLGAIGIVPLAVTTSLHMNFLRKPAADRAILGEARLIKLGRRLAVAEVQITSEGDERIVAQASLTYSIPPLADSKG